MVPIRRAQDLACEVAEPGDAGILLGHDVGPYRGDEEARGDHGAVGGVHRPPLVGLVPDFPDHAHPEPEMGHQPGLLRDPLVIRLDFGAFREQSGPSRIAGEGVLVGESGNVDADAGVVVVAPTSADLAGALENDEVAKAVLHQSRTCADAARPGADDRDLVIGTRPGAHLGVEGVGCLGHVAAFPRTCSNQYCRYCILSHDKGGGSGAQDPNANWVIPEASWYAVTEWSERLQTNAIRA